MEQPGSTPDNPIVNRAMGAVLGSVVILTAFEAATTFAERTPSIMELMDRVFGMS